MSHRLIVLLIAVYAMAFASAAMAVIRWPSLMTLAGLIVEPDLIASQQDMKWRQLGIIYGAPCFLAALCFYAAALSLGRNSRTARYWFGLGCLSGLPGFYLVEFETGWWRDPGMAQGALAGAALAALLLGLAVIELTGKQVRPADRTRPVRKLHKKADRLNPGIQADEARPAPQPDKARTRKYTPQQAVPAAIARQRAHFAAEGRRMLARRRAV